MRRFSVLGVSGALAASVLVPASACAASIEKSIDLKVQADNVWEVVGPFCSIKTWQPSVSECRDDNGTRTLTTKDGKQFVEKQTDRDDKAHSYSYEIAKSPLPVTDYKSTFKVVGRESGASVYWSATYTPAKDKEQEAETAISSIYQAGLDTIAKLTAK